MNKKYTPVKPGDRFGKWTVIKKAPRDESSKAFWFCKCDCGRIRKVADYNLKIGHTQSCGCAPRAKRRKYKPIQPGDKFGRLTVIEEAPPNEYSAIVRPQWVCKCECGNTTIVNDMSLKQKQTKSCGCLRKERCSQSLKKYWKEKKKENV
jgi:hypothetical protein